MKKIWFVAFAYWVGVSLLTCWLYPCMLSDVISRYAPMADAFARGDWAYAFHPRFGVLFQCISGSLAWLGLKGDCACQVTAILFLSLAAVPLWCLARKLFDEEIAWWSVAMLLVCENFFANAMDGLRDDGKCLAFALIAWGAVSARTRWIGLGLFVLTSLVSYGFALGTSILFVWWVLQFATREPRRLVLPTLGWGLGTAAVTVMVHAFTKHWLPAPHFIKYVGDWL